MFLMQKFVIPKDPNYLLKQDNNLNNGLNGSLKDASSNKKTDMNDGNLQKEFLQRKASMDAFLEKEKQKREI